jgi:RNA polymerase sigma factor (sigma-70 family)
MGTVSQKDVKSSISLKIIEKIAINTIIKQGKGKIKLSRDNIDYVMERVLSGYTRFDPNKGMKLKSFLINNAIYAVKNIFNGRLKDKKLLSLDNPLNGDLGRILGYSVIEDRKQTAKKEAQEIVEYIDKTNWFNDRQRKVLIRYFIENESVDSLAEELNIHQSYVYFLINDGIEKLRWRFNNE